MNRRDFLLAASAAAGGTAAAGTAAAQQGNTSGGNQTGGNITGNATGGGNQTGNATGNATGNQSAGGGQNFSGGGTETVNVGPGGNYVFAPGTEQPLYIQPGTKVKFVWKSDNHNIVVGSQPENANWSGHEPLENTGFTSSYTFTKMGKYHYWCDPHKGLGMVADIVVNSSGQAPGGGGEEKNPEEYGVPLQAHFVGIATVLMMVVSLVYTFFLVKYGESPNAKGGD
jgi:plastocyanin